jgi:hypothetical protein
MEEIGDNPQAGLFGEVELSIIWEKVNKHLYPSANVDTNLTLGWNSKAVGGMVVPTGFFSGHRRA